MPIYEYVCQSCGTKFEKLVRGMSSTEPIECPECNSQKVKKAFSVFGLSHSSSTISLSSAAASCTTGST